MKQWMLKSSLGVMLGLLAAGSVWLVVADSTAPIQGGFATLGLLLVCAAMGVLQGVVMGYFQHLGLVPLLPGLPRGLWLRGTAIAGGLLWVVGLLPFVLPASAQLAFWQSALLPFMWLGAVAFLVLVAFGTAQGRLLAAFHPALGRAWVRHTALGWVLGGLVAGGAMVLVLSVKVGFLPAAVVFVLLFAGFAGGAAVLSFVLWQALRRLVTTPPAA
jgi:hypothetical protein